VFSDSLVANGQQTQLASSFRKLHLGSEKAELVAYCTIAVAVTGGVCIHATRSLPSAKDNLAHASLL
jgi:hypothetical protein